MDRARRKSVPDGPGLQVICLGAGGGPTEHNVTGFLVRSTASDWNQKGTVLAVDAGTHLSAIIDILANDFPLVAPQPDRGDVSSDNTATAGTPCPDDEGVGEGDDDGEGDESSRPCTPEPTLLTKGPFAGASFPHVSARANGVHFVREHVDSFLITHPHLDHLSGFAMNTAAFHNTSKPKKVSALPFVVNAIKQHIFNDVIWPNLTDEADGVGFVTFQRLQEGGNLALGEGHSRGFIEVVNGLAVKAFKVSHGTCASTPRAPDRRSSRDYLGGQGLDRGQQTPHYGHSHGRPVSHSTPPFSNLRYQTLVPETAEHRRASVFSQPSQPANLANEDSVVDSSAFFIRADASGREVLIFGDVEPDSVSALPRNMTIWAEAAPKIAAGLLSGIFIECSYTDAQPDKILFGHLAPRHLIAELQNLAELVVEARRELAEAKAASPAKKRKRAAAAASTGTTPFGRSTSDSFLSRTRAKASIGQILETAALSTPASPATGPTTDSPAGELDDAAPLRGVQVIIIHVKDNMTDGPLVGDVLLGELLAHEAELRRGGRGLGCQFQVSRSGGSYYF